MHRKMLKTAKITKNNKKISKKIVENTVLPSPINRKDFKIKQKLKTSVRCIDGLDWSRTPAFQAGYPGSNPGRCTTFFF
jgi:hypothetical protein